MKNYIFTYQGDKYAVHHGAVYHWHGDDLSGHVSNIPCAFMSLNKGLKAYGNGRELTHGEFKVFGLAINNWNIRNGKVASND